MGQVSSKFRRAQGGLLLFWCPGCDGFHQVKVEGPGAWGFNGNLEAPTFTPSVLITSGHYVPGWKGPSCWCTYNAERPGNPAPFKCERCHTFVTDGQIQFLGDCTHALAGKTVPMPPMPPEHCDPST